MDQGSLSKMTAKNTLTGASTNPKKFEILFWLELCLMLWDSKHKMGPSYIKWQVGSVMTYRFFPKIPGKSQTSCNGVVPWTSPFDFG